MGRNCKWFPKLSSVVHFTLSSMIRSSAAYRFLLAFLLMTFATRKVIEAEGLRLKDHQGENSDEEITETTRKQISLKTPQTVPFSLQTGYHTLVRKPHFDIPQSPMGNAPDQLSLGSHGMETKQFFRICQRFCEQRSGLRCHRVRKHWRKSAEGCKSTKSLGYVNSPSCCFYKRCFRLRRPSGRNRFWWRKRSVQDFVERRGCARNHAWSILRHACT